MNLKHNFSFCQRSCLKNCNVLKRIFFRHASTGLGLWSNPEITDDQKHKIEEYWKDKIHEICNNNETSKHANKFYVLSMFPYPSGHLHMGHVRVYTISDAIARFYRMKGKYVIHPIGWDSFGLPAENAAVERNIDPEEWTKMNIDNMREQLYRLGCSFDKEREISTSDPKYYKWTQELFLKLYENGLIYQKEDFVNWDPVDGTVLAEEQIDEDGRSWRSGAIVEKKLLRQWFIKTTVFAKQLLEGLKDPKFKEWRDVLKLQEHWIGQCTGTNFNFSLTKELPECPKFLTLYTDKPEYIEQAKFILMSNNSILSKTEYCEDDKGDEGIKKVKASIINPFTNEILPIYVVNKENFEFPQFRDDYIGIPCVSERDAEFCKTMGIEYKQYDFASSEEIEKKKLQILETARNNNIGGYLVSPRIKDWLISRQRYWGTPIPLVHCKKCGCQPIPRNQLPITLPKISRNFGEKRSLLQEASEWLNTICPKCSGPAVRETDTMDTFVDSSWYFMRYIDPCNEKEMFSKEKASKFLPVDLYIGGKEHAVLHLYYARFISHFLHKIGLVPTSEPFVQLLVQGIVKGIAFCNKDGKYLKRKDVIEEGLEFLEKKTGKPVHVVWEKMSKSKYNGVDPSKEISEHSADTIRLIMLADVAPTSDRKWTCDTFPGIINWEKRLWLTLCSYIEKRNATLLVDADPENMDDELKKQNDYLFDSRNYYIHGVTFNITDAQQLSVAISKMQGLTNSIRKVSQHCMSISPEFERALAAQIIMLAPLAPHFASELWAGFCSVPYKLVTNGELQYDEDVLNQRWPEVDKTYKIKLRVTVNGKKLITMRVPYAELDSMDKAKVFDLVMNDNEVKQKTRNKDIIGFHYHDKTGAGASVSLIVKNKIILNEAYLTNK